MGFHVRLGNGSQFRVKHCYASNAACCKSIGRISPLCKSTQELVEIVGRLSESRYHARRAMLTHPSAEHNAGTVSHVSHQT